VVVAEPVNAVAVFLHILCQPPARVVWNLELEIGRGRLTTFFYLFCWSLAAESDW
jgi:hypothetical protein